ncbi:peptidase E [Brachybacterium sp. P6-10-X1]|uniref:Type 1 glutamine amidotransferase-like domain-containing protein n=1 Tax=Brachybacterium sp. P6-10-X1 TaxID=1903186 RepID=UPI0009718ABB|nr:peptidase E [Brachybacterium sp. P6-10-X1]APX32218.1 peptidase E [Brachybacterium sp. P6-10-X1]
MPAAVPTILATSAGYLRHPRLRFGFGPMMAFAVQLAQEAPLPLHDRHDSPPRICNIGTASGDDKGFQRDMEEAAREAGYELHHLSLFSMPNVEDVEGYLRGFDVIWVNGGSVVNLLAVWRAHGLPEILHRLWQEGVVLGGISAGSICWFEGGVTDSFGPELAPVTNGLGFLPGANGVHMDSEERRRPLIRELVADGTLGPTLCTDDGAGLLFRGAELTEAVAELDGARACRIALDAAGAVVESELPVRRLD